MQVANHLVFTGLHILSHVPHALEGLQGARLVIEILADFALQLEQP